MQRAVFQKLIFALLAFMLCGAIPVFADDYALDTLGFIEKSAEPLVTTSRTPRPLSQTAENVSVITSKEIESLNAHTLADILYTVSGIQVQHNGGPGITSYTYIQSANPFFTQVFVDGVSLNSVANNFADISSIPAHIIDRIEIMKGAASTSWGSALAGVINVITKSPLKERAISGSATVSTGSRFTTDTWADLSGTVGKVGYYLSGGYLGSDGLIPTMEIRSQHVYTKLTYDLPGQGHLWSTLFYNHASMGDLYAVPIDLRERSEKTNLLASLGLRYTLAEGLELEVSARHSDLPSDFSYYNISDGGSHNGWAPDSYKDQTTGGSANLRWRKNSNLLAAGVDYSHQEAEYVDYWSRKAHRWGVYLNDTLALGSVSISPSLRFDRPQTSGGQVSSALGITWKVTDKTLLRGYTGRGYNIPILNGPIDNPSQKIWTNQIGIESTVIPYLWVKGTLFRNGTWGETVDRNLALGSELEVRTIPIFNTSLGAAWTYTETTRTSDDTSVRPDRPTNTVKLAMRYDDKTFRGTLIGNHINWNSPADFNGKYSGLIWDLHLGATLLKRENTSLELFFSGRNLFNGSSSYRDLVPTVGRWFDGGLRVNF